MPRFDRTTYEQRIRAILNSPPKAPDGRSAFQKYMQERRRMSKRNGKGSLERL